MAAIIGDAHGGRQGINDTCTHALARISSTLQHGAANSALPFVSRQCLAAWSLQ
jgi:hypothetical protein